MCVFNTLNIMYVVLLSYSFMRTIQWMSLGELWKGTVFIDQKKYVVAGIHKQCCCSQSYITDRCNYRKADIDIDRLF